MRTPPVHLWGYSSSPNLSAQWAWLSHCCTADWNLRAWASLAIGTRHLLVIVAQVPERLDYDIGIPLISRGLDFMLDVVLICDTGTR